MFELASGFIILTCSLAGIAVLIATAVLSFMEHVKSAWRYQTVIKIVISLSLCYGSNLLIYCAEVAPSLLFGTPVYGRFVHGAAGWIILNSHYVSILHLLLLNILKIDFVYASDSRSRRLWLSNLLIFGIWLVAAMFSSLILSRACSYVFSVEKIIFSCENPDDSNRLLIIFATLSGSFLFLSVITAGYQFLKKASSRGKWQESCASELKKIRRNWSILLVNELVISGAKLITAVITSLSANEILAWHGLSVSVFSILCDVLSLRLYFRILTQILQAYSRIDDVRRRRSRSVTFRKSSRLSRSRGSVGSRRSCRSSQRSCQGSLHRFNREMAPKICLTNARNQILPLDADSLETTVITTATIEPVKQAWRICTDTCTDHGGSQLPMAFRPVPIVQIQVYRNYEEDANSLCNYCSYSESSDSLKERSMSACVEFGSNSECPPVHCDCATPTTPLSLRQESEVGSPLRKSSTPRN